MKVLIVGGAGFIGSHLCQNHLENGDQVICLDNFYTGSKKNIIGFLGNKNFKFVRHDIINEIHFDEEIDFIYSLACPASPRHYQKDPLMTTKASIFGAFNLLELAREHRAKILHASTSEVYGDPEVHPQSEAYWGKVNPNGIRSCYDEGKRCAESIFFDYKRVHNVNIKVVRIFNTYGPNMDFYDGRVVSNFIIQALQNKDITIYGNGFQTRSFQYIDDLVNGFLKFMYLKDDFAGPINIGNDQEFTIRELAEKVIKLIPETQSKIIYQGLPQDDPKQRRPDISLARRILDWEPKINLEDGLIKTINYFKKNI